MKNLITIGIEKLEELPIKTLSILTRKRHLIEMYKHHNKRGCYDTVGDVPPWKLAEYIIKKYIGLTFDEAYSEYRRRTKWYQREYFLNEFSNFNHRYRYRYYCDYEVIDGIITIVKDKNEYKGPYTFKSIDATFELRHKVTGAKKPEYTWNARYIKGVPHYKMQGKFGYYTASDRDFVPILVKGWIKIFESKQNPEFKRFNAEKQQALRISMKSRQKEAQEKAYNFMTKSEMELKELRKTDTQKILQHGFDLVTSFRA